MSDDESRWFAPDQDGNDDAELAYALETDGLVPDFIADARRWLIERDRCEHECASLHRLLKERNLALYCHESELQTENDRLRAALEYTDSELGKLINLAREIGHGLYANIAQAVVDKACAALGKDGGK